MSQGLFTTAYLPPVEYFMQMKHYEEALIEQHEHYQKQSYRNRCCIAGPNGINELSIPVDKQGRVKVYTKDLRISRSVPWQNLHWRSIQTAYNNSPFFLYYRDELEPFYHRKFDFLLDFNQELLQLVLKWLKMRTVIGLTEAFLPLRTLGNDHRYTIHPKLESALALPAYYQVFMEKFGFQANLSIIDLLFNEGPGGVEGWRG